MKLTFCVIRIRSVRMWILIITRVYYGSTFRCVFRYFCTALCTKYKAFGIKKSFSNINTPEYHKKGPKPSNSHHQNFSLLKSDCCYYKMFPYYKYIQQQQKFIIFFLDAVNVESFVFVGILSFLCCFVRL